METRENISQNLPPPLAWRRRWTTLEVMKAWVIDHPGPIANDPLYLADKPAPRPGPHEVRVTVSACGVCRTDLHLAEGDLPLHKSHLTPGHEVVGRVTELGEGSTRFRLDDRVGVAWLRSTCGTCRWCQRGDENLCLSAHFTGWDEDGGYAEQLTVPEAFAYRIPERFDDAMAAPLLCAGIIGYRALKHVDLHASRRRLGIYGFGASAHLAAQVALHQGAVVHVLTRSPEAQRLALDLGCASAGEAYDEPPEPLDAALLFAPVGELVPTALEALDQGGILAIAGIHLSDIPPLNYQRHLFRERSLRSVTANTRADGEAFLRLAGEMGIDVRTTPYAFDRADVALTDLANDRVDGAAVLVL